MNAIITKYLPFTNTKPSRIKASAEGVPSKIWTCNELKNYIRSPHIQAAHLFCADNNWSGNLASGQLPSGDWAHCFISGQRDLKQTNALKTAIISNIQWDYDDDDDDDDDGDEKLPLPVTLTLTVPAEISHDELEEFLSDEISNLTGYCHYGFSYKLSS